MNVHRPTLTLSPRLARLPLSYAPAIGVARLLLWASFGLLTLYAAFYVHHAAQLIAYPFGVDQGEAYDALSAWIVRSGQLPYFDNAAYPYYSSNYPPLWSMLVALAMSWLGPTLGTARAVSVLSALAAALLLGAAAYRRAQREGFGHPWLVGMLAAGLFLASPYVFHTTPLARVNATALLCALLAVSLVEVPSRRRVVLAGLALLAALFTKPTAIDAAAASILFLALVAPGRGTGLAVLLLAAGSIGLAGLTLATSGAFWVNVVAGNINPFDEGQLGAYLLNFGALHGLLLVLAGAEAVREVRCRRWSPWSLLLGTAGLMSLAVGKWGAGESYFLTLIAAMSVLAATALARQLPSGYPAPREASIPLLLALALFLQVLVQAHGPLSAWAPWLPDRGVQAATMARVPTEADRQEASVLAERMRVLGGPVLSEEPSFPFVAGLPIVGNATHLRNLHQAGLWDPTGLVADIRARRFALVVLGAELFPAPVLEAIGRSYYVEYVVVIHGAPYQIFLPGADVQP